MWSVGPNGSSPSASAAAAMHQSSSVSHPVVTGGGQSGQTITSSTSGRMVQKQAALTMEVAHVQATGARIAERVEHLHGFVANTQMVSSGLGGARHSIAMTIRVPQNNFSHVIPQLQGMGTQKAFSQHGIDVTRRYQSLRLQKTTLQDEVLADQRLFRKATSMKTMLQIQQALAIVQAHLQSVQQQQSSLTRSVNLSTISLTLLPVSPALQRVQGFGLAFGDSWNAMTHVGATLVVGAGWCAPWIILLALVAIPSRYRWLRRHRQKGNTTIS